MLPYSAGLILDNSNNYGIVKTETLFGFAPENQDGFINNFNITEPLQWVLTRGNVNKREESSRTFTGIIADKPSKNIRRKSTKKIKRSKKIGNTGKLCKNIYKMYKKKNRKNKSNNMRNKYMLPMMIGMMAAKSILIPVALKTIAFISAKGLMMGFFSTIMASLLSLKGIFEHSYSSQNRKDDTKTQVEIIHVPSHSEDHIYHDDHYSRGDYFQLPQELVG